MFESLSFSIDKITSMIDVDDSLKAVSDTVKGAKAIVGKSVGKGLEREFLLPFGQDTLARVGQVQDRLLHSVEVFRKVSEDLFLRQ